MSALAIPRTTSPILDSQRASIISTSGSSFQTAQSHSQAPSSPSSSTSTLPAPTQYERANSSLPILHQSQEVHLLTITDDAVKLDSGPSPDSLLHKVGRSLLSTPLAPGPAPKQDLPQPALFNQSDVALHKVGPPPPSPPASDEQAVDEEISPKLTPKVEPKSPAVTFGTSLRERQPSSTSASSYDVSHKRPAPILHRASTETKTSISSRLGHSTTTTPPRFIPMQATDSPVSDSFHVAETSTSSQPARTKVSNDAFLRPPQVRPKRRNTIGTASPMHPFPYDDIHAEGELANEIQQQQEQLIRERQTKRAKAQQQQEAASKDPEKPLVGSWVKEGHQNYVLMYNMLTGIRIAVSRCQAKVDREITPGDYTAAHKYSFDIFGNELTPSVKYDFKFKDYAPWVFRSLREQSFHLDPADYLLSLTEKYILSELGSPGKSGSFFYFSRDYRFIIKTIHYREHKFIRKILKDYHEHVRKNPHTLLSRFYGLHRVKLPRGRKIHFVIMNNLFPPHKDIHETYDLKGSTVGRLYPEDVAARKQNKVTLKDLNWINRGKQLELGPEKRAFLTEQLKRDAEFLKQVHVMDYSLLVGVHNMVRGNRDNLRRNTLKVVTVPDISRGSSQSKPIRSPAALRRAMRETGPERLDSDTDHLPDSETGDERQHFIFYQDDGGLRATDESNAPIDTIYYLGIIDICTPYTTLKRAEHIWKGLHADRHKISPVEPGEYAERFFAFLKAVMRDGEGGERFKAE